MMRVTLLVLAAIASAVQGMDFYPSDHFDYVTKIQSEDHLNEYLESQISQDKTVFVRWIAAEG